MTHSLWFEEANLSPLLGLGHILPALTGLCCHPPLLRFPTALAVGHILPALTGLRAHPRHPRA